MIPNELFSYHQWSSCVPGTKRPIVDPDKGEVGFSYDEINKEHNYGFVLTARDPFVIIDIDNDKENPLSVKELLSTCPEWVQKAASLSYAEISPSGHGVHIILRLKSGEKARVRKRAYFKARDFEGQVSIQRAFMTVTGNQLPESGSEIKATTLEKLSEYFKLPNLSKETSDEPKVDFDLASVPPLDKIEHYMSLIPIDQGSRIQEVYKQITEVPYAHYDYWIMIGMALNDYALITGSMVECFTMFLEWSKRDEDAFVSEADVESHWRSFAERDDKISYKTLISFASKMEFDWPYPVMKKGEKTGNPVPVEIANFKYLMEYYNLQITRDRSSGQYFVSGQDDICKRYFLNSSTECYFDKYYGPFFIENLSTAFLLLCQDNHYRSTTLRMVQDMVKVVTTTTLVECDLFSTWLDMDANKLPDDLQNDIQYNDNSNIDYILSCIQLAPTMEEVRHTLVRSVLKKWFMGIVKLREDLNQPFDQNGGMLFFIGPENSRKTTFFNMLMPKALQKIGFIKSINTNLRGDKDQRDFLRALGTRVIVVIDEYEGINQTFLDSQMKNLISTNDVSFVDIYSTGERRLSRSAMICATSNSFKQRLSSNGTRRMWCVQVNWIDTDALLQINWHKFYRDLRNEFRYEVERGNTPWLLTPEEIDLLNSYNRGVMATTDLQLMLESVFDFSHTFPGLKAITSVQADKTGMLFKTVDVLTALQFKLGAGRQIKLSALENELSRMCGIWTGTDNQIVQLKRPRAIVQNGLIKQGPHKRWILPPTDFGDD